MVEQFRVRGRFSEPPEVAGSQRKRSSEEETPDPVHQDACREGIGRAGDGIGEFPSSAAIFEGQRLFLAQHAQETPLHHRAFLRHVAAQENVEVRGCAVFNDVERTGSGVGGRPVRSKVRRRISVTRSTSGEGVNFLRSS